MYVKISNETRSHGHGIKSTNEILYNYSFHFISVVFRDRCIEFKIEIM